MLSAKPSMPMLWARVMSFVQSFWVYDATIPTYWVHVRQRSTNKTNLTLTMKWAKTDLFSDWRLHCPGCTRAPQTPAAPITAACSKWMRDRRIFACGESFCGQYIEFLYAGSCHRRPISPQIMIGQVPLLHHGSEMVPALVESYKNMIPCRP